MTTLTPLHPPPPLPFVGGGLSSDKAAKLFYMTLQDYVIKNYERELFIVCGDSAKTDSHRHCVDEYIYFSVCHIFLQEHMIIWSCDFMGRGYSW